MPHPLQLIAPFLRRADRLIGLGLVGAGVAIAISFFVQPHYRVEARFVSEASPGLSLENSLGPLASFASRLGVGGVAGRTPPEFYVQVLHTRTILDPVIQKRYAVARGQRSGDSLWLLDVLKAPAKLLPLQRLELGARAFERRMNTSIDDASGIISVSIDMPDPDLGVAVTREVLTQLDSFNLSTRRTEAKNRRLFVERRVQAARAQLDSAELSLQNFYTTNRTFASSPALSFREARLRRSIDMAQAVYTTMTQQLEQARVDEVRDTPTLTIVEMPIAPYKPQWPRKSILAVIGFVFGMIVGSASILWNDVLPPDSAARSSVAAVGTALRDLLVRWRLLPRGTHGA